MAKVTSSKVKLFLRSTSWNPGNVANELSYLLVDLCGKGAGTGEVALPHLPGLPPVELPQVAPPALLAHGEDREQGSC